METSQKDHPGDDTHMERVQKILHCFICYDRASNARLCPRCSHICCLDCISKWLEDHSQCPHCRSELSVHDLVRANFVEEVNQELEKFAKRGSGVAEELCQAHGSSLQYFCRTCSTSICADCAMFSDVHKGHQFERLEQVYGTRTAGIREKVEKLRQRLAWLASITVQVENRMESVGGAKRERLAEVQTVVEKILTRVETQAKDRAIMLQDHRGECVRAMEMLHEQLQEVETQMQSVPKSMLVARAEELHQALDEVLAIRVDHLGELPREEELNFASEVVPPWQFAEFDIHNYRVHCSTGEVIYSECLCLNGLSWRLKVYPNGNGVAEGRHLSVFLEMVAGLPEPSTYDYRIELLPYDDGAIVAREFTSTFEAGECWGYNRFALIGTLEAEGYLTQDTLLLRFAVRPPTYVQLCGDQARYCDDLEAHAMTLATEVGALRSRLCVAGLGDPEWDDPTQEERAAGEAAQEGMVHSEPQHDMPDSLRSMRSSSAHEEDDSGLGRGPPVAHRWVHRAEPRGRKLPSVPSRDFQEEQCYYAGEPPQLEQELRGNAETENRNIMGSEVEILDDSDRVVYDPACTEGADVEVVEGAVEYDVDRVVTLASLLTGPQK